MKNLPKLSDIPEKKLKLFVSFLGIFLFMMPVFDYFTLGNSGQDLILPEENMLSFMNNNSLLPVSSPSAPEPKVVKKMPVVITAYSSTVWETDDTPFITAANTSVRDGIIANNYLPFGTKVRIPELYGDKIFVVEDRMSSTKGNYHVDIWFPSYWEAKEFGAKKTYIEVLES